VVPVEVVLDRLHGDQVGAPGVCDADVKSLERIQHFSHFCVDAFDLAGLERLVALFLVHNHPFEESEYTVNFVEGIVGFPN